MIKPIILLLVAATFLAQLDQSNGEKKPKKPCRSFFYECTAMMYGIRVIRPNICVPFSREGRKCQPTMDEQQLIEKCMGNIKDPRYYGIRAKRTKKQCSILPVPWPEPGPLPPRPPVHPVPYLKSNAYPSNQFDHNED